MSDRALLRLRDALEACEACMEIEFFIRGISLAEYESNRGLRLQIERLLEIVGEALNQARSINPSVTSSITELPMIIGMRNQIIHGYQSINDDIVWSAAIDRIPGLRRQLESIIAVEDGRP